MQQESSDQIRPLTKEEIAEIFKIFDKDDSGTFDPKKLGELMSSIGRTPSSSQLSHIIAQISHRKDGSVGFEEFVKFMRDLSKPKPFNESNELMEAFEEFDKDGDGNISKQELKDVMDGLSITVSDGELQDMVNEADVNQDGRVDYDDFVATQGKT